MAENSLSELNEKMPLEEEAKEELKVEDEEAVEECNAKESCEEDHKDEIKKRTKRNIIKAPLFGVKDDKTQYRRDANGCLRPVYF